MASFCYIPAKAGFWNGNIDLDTHDIRGLLVMTNTTADTETNTTFIAGFGTLDEFDGANYSRQALTGEVVTADVANNRAEFDANDSAFGTAGSPLGVGTRSVQGMVIFRFVTNDADSRVIFFIDLTPSFAPRGIVTIQWDAEGIAQLT